MNRFAIALTMCAVPVATASPAFADEVLGRSMIVQVSEQQLDDPAGIAQLEDNVRRAARTVCTRDNGFAPPSRSELTCFVKAVSGAKRRLAAMQASYISAKGG